MKKHLHKIYTSGILLVLFLFAFQQGVAQCAMCRATVENNVSNGETTLASNLNLGILYLFVTPYLVIGVIAFLWYKKSKANAKKVRLTSYYRGKMPQM